MKRINNLFEKVISLENLELADKKAQKGKSKQYGVLQHNKNAAENLLKLHALLKSRNYKTSPYETFMVYEPKEREVYRLPYFPDRIMHHAIMHHLKPIFMTVFTGDSYSCIEGKGIHAAQRAVEKALQDKPGTTYCLKLDIKKFYPSVKHPILKNKLRRKIKDGDLLWLLDEIIDSAPGLPIGNYLSQYFANFYLTYFDHWIKENQGVKYYFRYADDIVILADDKRYLHALLADIRKYMDEQLQLTIKSNYQIFPVESRGIDFVGYVFYHTHTRIRKSIKQNFARMLKRSGSHASIAAYMGWLGHANTYSLQNKLLTNEQIFRLCHRAKNRRLYRRQNKDEQSAEQENPSAEIQNRTIEVCEQRSVSLSAD